jgi:DNA-binding CsgD family transcriptional regulator/tetratricopeptide (TPR) repeat protein
MGRVGPLLSPLLVGRDDLLALADRRIEEASGGRGHALLLSGQAGLGKTRLSRAIAHKARTAGMRVTAGSVAPHDLQVPLASIRELATSMRGAGFGSLPDDLLAIDGRHDGDALGARRLIVRSAADHILEAIDRPTLLIFDDLHWTDEVSLEVIGELARHASSRPLLMVGDYRADELPADTIHREWRARLLNQRHAEEVRLLRLTRDQTGLMTTLLLGGELPAPSDVVDAVYERTNGIPLHVEELIAALDDVDRLDGRQVRDARVPDTIGDAVLARLSRLSPDAQLVARAGSVVGRCFSPDVIAGLVGRPMAEIEPSLGELVGAAILYPFDYIDQGYYDFRHQLLRDAVYGSVPPSELRRFHAQAAEFVMTLQASSIVHASRHYERAGLREEAFRTSLSAAREAGRISARHESYELYRRAIANMPAGLPIDDQAELYDEFADAASAIEQNEDCATASARARELFLEAGRPIKAALALIGTSTLLGRGGAPSIERLGVVDQAIAEVEAQPPSPEREQARALLLGWRASDHFLSADLPAARRDALAARDLALAIDDREAVLEADLLMARIAVLEGDEERGMRDGLHAAREARDAGFESVGVTGYRNLAILAARLMDATTAELALAEGLQYADAIEQSHCRQMMATTRAMLDWAAGDWKAADDRARQELAEVGCRRGVLGAMDVIGLVALGRGGVDEARRWLDDSLATGRRIGEAHLQLTPLWGLAETALVDGDPARAIEHCEEGLRLALEAGERALLVPFVVTGVRACLEARRPDEAEAWLARVRDHLAGWNRAATALEHADGLVRLAAGSTVSARSSLQQAVAGWDGLGRTWEAAWARLDLAACLIRGNRHAEALPVLEEIRPIAGRLQSEPIRSRLDELASIARRRGVTEEPWRPLTAREFEVARLIAEGMTNAAIAGELVLSPKTVSAHVEHILAKLDATRRAEIAAWATTIAAPVAGDRAAGPLRSVSAGDRLPTRS